MTKIIPHSFRFIFLLALQVLILDHVMLGGLFNPYLYVFFILMLPFDVAGWVLLTFSFLLGLSVDIFSDTAGLHAGASVLTAFSRPFIIRMISTKEESESSLSPALHEMGFSWVFRYSLIVIFIHNLSLFMFEAFSFNGFWFTLQKTMASTALTTFLILLIHYMFYKHKK